MSSDESRSNSTGPSCEPGWKTAHEQARSTLARVEAALDLREAQLKVAPVSIGELDALALARRPAFAAAAASHQELLEAIATLEAHLVQQVAD